MKLKNFTLLLLTVFLMLPMMAQKHLPLNEEESCSFEQAMQDLYDKNPEALVEAQNFEKLVQAYAKKKKAGNLKATKYIIPVVFHVYGNEWDGKIPVSDARMKEALAAINDNFKGFNDAVDSRFSNVEAGMDVEFRLAQIDPNGNTTTGIIYHEYKEGFGLSTTNDAEIAKYAWDNYKYFNTHIQLIIKSGSLTSSGIAWFPSTSMSDKGTARVVYNGKYIIYSPPASSLTHEFGHFFGLEHTFNDGCVSTGGDLVDDTPPCTAGQAGSDCANPDVKNCFNDYINYDNHMDYNPCETMFTQGQVTRMESFMEHPARITLWTDANIIATGVKNDLGKRILFSYQQPDDSDLDKYLNLVEGVANDGSVANKRKIKAIEGVQFAVIGLLSQGTHFNVSNIPSGLTTRINVLDATTAEIYFDGKATQHTDTDSKEFTITLLDAAVSGGVSQLYTASGKYKIEFLKPYDKYYEVLSPHIMIGITTNFQTGTKTQFTSPAIATGLTLNIKNWNGDAICIDNYNYNFDILCNSGTRNVTLLSDAASISASSNGDWVVKPGVSEIPPVISGPGYSTWNGKTAYAGMRIPTIQGGYIYGWIKIRVSPSGNLGTMIAFGVNEKPDDAMTADISKPMVMYLNDRFLESASNNGSIGNQLSVQLYNTTFAKTGTLTEGTHYTIENVPSGMQFSVNATSSTTALLTMSGVAGYYMEFDYYSNINLQFLDGAFSSHNASQVFQSSYQLHVEYLGETFIQDLTGLVMYSDDESPNSAGFSVLSSGQSLCRRQVTYQLQVYTNGNAPGIKFISWRKDAIANSNYELTPINAGVEIGPNSSWKNGREYHIDEGQHMIDSDTYQDWRGQTKYIGIRFQRSGRMHYGWIEMYVSSQAKTLEFRSFGVSGKPDTGILAGSTTAGSTTGVEDGGLLLNGVGASGTMDSSDGSDIWYIDVPANAESMHVVLETGSSDFDIYGKYNTEPSTSTYDWRGYTSGGEDENVQNPSQGRHYIMVDYYSGSGSYTLTATITVTADSQSPTAPTNLTYSNVTETAVDLSWNASIDNVGVTDYEVYQDDVYIGSTPNTNYNVIDLTKGNTYKFYVVALDAAGNVSPSSNEVIVATPGETPGCTSYCASKGTSQQYEWITDVIVGNYSNSTGAESGGYGDYTSESISMTPGANVNVTLTPNTFNYTEAFKVWIDYNNNCDFEDLGELVLSGSAKGSTNGVINVPSDVSGTTRMRISMKYSSAASSSCGDIGDGEVEDYTVDFGGIIVDPEPPSDPTNLSSNNVTNTSVDLSWTASTDNVGVTGYRIEYGSQTINIGNVVSYVVEGLTADTDYTFTVKAKDAAGNISGASNSVNVRTLSDVTPPPPYCEASASNGPEHIANVQIGSISNSTSRDADYNDFTTQSTNLSKGSNYTLSVTVGDPYNSSNEVTAWIDWNIDGDFDDSGERYDLTVNSDTDRSITVAVPSNATTGTTRLRVRVSYYDTQAIPCGTNSYGEVEDYTINVSSTKSVLTGNEGNSLNILTYPNPSIGVFTVSVASNEIGVGILKIVGLTGQVVFVKEFEKTDESFEIPVETDLNPGVYNMQIIIGNMSANEKLVFE